MSKTEAAFLILKETKRKMTYKELIDISIKRNLIQTNGKTPEATLRVDILKENQRKQLKGVPLRFNISDSRYVSLY